MRFLPLDPAERGYRLVVVSRDDPAAPPFVHPAPEDPPLWARWPLWVVLCWIRLRYRGQYEGFVR